MTGTHLSRGAGAVLAVICALLAATSCGRQEEARKPLGSEEWQRIAKAHPSNRYLPAAYTISSHREEAEIDYRRALEAWLEFRELGPMASRNGKEIYFAARKEDLAQRSDLLESLLDLDRPQDRERWRADLEEVRIQEAALAKLKAATSATRKPGFPRVRILCHSYELGYLVCVKESEFIRTIAAMEQYDEAKLFQIMHELETWTRRFDPSDNVLFHCGGGRWGATSADSWLPQLAGQSVPTPRGLLGLDLSIHSVAQQHALLSVDDMTTIAMACAWDQLRGHGAGSGGTAGSHTGGAGSAGGVGDVYDLGAQSECVQTAIARQDSELAACQDSASTSPTEGGETGTGTDTDPGTGTDVGTGTETGTGSDTQEDRRRRWLEMMEAMKKEQDEKKQQESKELADKLKAANDAANAEGNDPDYEALKTAIGIAIDKLMEDHKKDYGGSTEVPDTTMIEIPIHEVVDKIKEIVDRLKGCDPDMPSGACSATCEEKRIAWDFLKYSCRGQWDIAGSGCNQLVGCESSCPGYDPTVATPTPDGGDAACASHELSDEQRAELQRETCEKMPYQSVVAEHMSPQCNWSTGVVIEGFNPFDVACGPEAYGLDCDVPDLGAAPVGGSTGPPLPTLSAAEVDRAPGILGDTVQVRLEGSTVSITSSLEDRFSVYVNETADASSDDRPVTVP